MLHERNLAEITKLTKGLNKNEVWYKLYGTKIIVEIVLLPGITLLKEFKVTEIRNDCEISKINEIINQLSQII